MHNRRNFAIADQVRNDVTSLPSYLPTLRASKRAAFTLAEVLITLAIVGVVAALTITSLVKDIRYKGYVEQLKKMHTTLQIATNAIIAEEGTPDKWKWTKHNDADSSANKYIAESYTRYLDVDCFYDTTSTGAWYANKFCPDKPIPSYKYLDGTVYSYYYRSSSTSVTNLYGWPLFGAAYNMILKNGAIISVNFGVKNGATFYNTPFLYFAVDINGIKGPNTIGRDVFFLYMKDKKYGTIVPFAGSDTSFKNKDTCNKNSKGFSCAYKILTEDNGKMKY